MAETLRAFCTKYILRRSNWLKCSADWQPGTSVDTLTSHQKVGNLNTSLRFLCSSIYLFVNPYFFDCPISWLFFFFLKFSLLLLFLYLLVFGLNLQNCIGKLFASYKDTTMFRYNYTLCVLSPFGSNSLRNQ